MANGEIKKLLDYANMQMAAEAFLARAADAIPNQPIQTVIKTRLEDGNTHTNFFTPTQAEQFAKDFEVVTQYRNDPELRDDTGFSATLFKNRSNDEYTLSIRSTEFLDDQIRDNISNQLEIADKGWAFGQIASMEEWYKKLRAPGGPLAGKKFNVTGYSLGAHLAAAFNILRREEGSDVILNTYTFNGAGTGQIKPGKTLTQLIADFNNVRKDYLASDQWKALAQEERATVLAEAKERVQTVLKEYDRVSQLPGIPNPQFKNSVPPLGDQAKLDYQVAAVLVGRYTIGGTASTNISFPADSPIGIKTAPTPAAQGFDKMIEVVGMETEGLATSFVSNSGIHYGTRLEVPIEAQPLYRGTVLLDAIRASIREGRPTLLVANPNDNDFGDTHSLPLIIDSLSLMAVMEKLSPTLTIGDAKLMFNAISNAAMETKAPTQGKTEGDTLERTLEAFRKLLVPENTPNRVQSFSEDDLKELLKGNTWHLARYRSIFQNQIAELKNRVEGLGAAQSQGLLLEQLVTPSATTIRDQAVSTDASGVAYRYALKELNPFVVSGGNANSLFYDQLNTSGELDLYDAGLRKGTFTTNYLDDRAQFLKRFTYYNERNARYDRSDGTTDPKDQTAEGYDPEDYIWIDAAKNITIQRGGVTASTRYFAFGGDGTDNVTGGLASDNLYGGGRCGLPARQR